MASVPYSGTTKESTYQISAYLVKKTVELDQKHVFGIVAGPSYSKWCRFHIQARLKNLNTRFQLIWLKYSQIRPKHVFSVVAGPSDSKWHKFHIQARLRNLHTKFQLNWLKIDRIRTKKLNLYEKFTHLSLPVAVSLEGTDRFHFSTVFLVRRVWGIC